MTQGELDRIRPVLDALESAFRPLVKELPLDVEPAVRYECPHAALPERSFGAIDAGRALRRREVSSVELVEAALAGVSRLGCLNAFITVMDEGAREAARRCDAELAAGRSRGPLHGVPVAVKDVFCTRGVRTTCGSKILAGYVPDKDAAVVERLAAAGAVVIGKTNMHEFAYGITSTNPHYGPVRNPWDTERVPGGSSGGSGAAVAAGIVPVAMGSDTGGSIRIPASFCGVVGLKPTFGRVSRYGVLPLDFSLDHMGPLAATVRDAAVVLNAIAGFDARDDTSSRHPVEDYVPPPGVSIRGMRLGLPENFYFERTAPETKEAVLAAARVAEALGAEIVPVRVPDIGALNVIGRVILLAEASAATEAFRDRRDEIGEDVRALLDQGSMLRATDYVNAQRLRRMKREEFGRLWEEVDCLLTPTTATAAPKIGQQTVEIGGNTEDVRLASTMFVRAINVLGLPAVSLPCGFDASGLPLGLQLIGRPFDEASLLRVAAALEDAGVHPRRTPAVRIA